jgi:hypothetical protein
MVVPARHNGAMTALRNDPIAVARDPLWLADRYDPGHDAVHFRQVSRSQHDRATFLTDEYLPASTPVVLRRSEAVAAAGAPGPLHFIFHSAYCCSTLLARVFDLPGTAMGLKEPVLLNDLVGWKHRGATPTDLAGVLNDALTLLARPFGPGEAVVVKPSNLINGMIPAMLTVRPAARALLLHAPLRTYLGSIAKKGMWGRLWVRDLLVKQLREGMVWPGFTTEDYLGQTDLQAGAAGWLAQHALFARMATRFPDRVRTLDSEALMADPAAAMAALGALFGLTLDPAAIVAGPAFTRHSKFGQDFGAEARAGEHRDAADLHADEIDKVAIWAEAVAASAGLSLKLPEPLLG